MKKCCITVASILACVLAVEAKTIGLWEDARSYICPELTNTLVKSGWELKYFKRTRTGNDLEDYEKVRKCDVLLFCGGWNAYFFPTPKARWNIIRHIASGKGALVSGFRSGYVRTANRPMFPQIGNTYNRLTSSWIGPCGKSPLAKAFRGKTIPAGGNDHLAIRVGEKGNLFCVSGEDAVGAYGEFYYGRVIVFGGHFVFNDAEMPEESAILKDLLKESLDYLTDQDQPSEEEAKIAIAAAEDEFVRRELLWTWTIDDRGPDRRPGYIPEIRDNICSPIESSAYLLEYLTSHFSPREKAAQRNLAKQLRFSADRVRSSAEKAIASMEKRIAGYSSAAIALEYLNGGAIFDKAAIERDLRRYVRPQDLAKAEEYIKQLKKDVKVVKKAKLEKEIEADLKKVPAILAKLEDPDSDIRFNAALEIGRISPDGDDVAMKLVKLFADPDERVRTQAIISLGWMRSRAAVDALIKLVGGKDVFDSRRAIQSLGHIGDKKAIPALRKALDSDDHRSRVLAALALGHLKAKEAVPELLALAKADPKHKSKEVRTSAILALGYIGDASVKQDLESLRAGAKDKPGTTKSRWGGPNYLSSPLPAAIYTSADIALKMIDEGGSKTLGVVQPEEYRSYDSFYAIKKGCNSFVGRTETIKGSFSGINQKILWPYVKNAGFTGVHNAWGWNGGWKPEDFVEVVRAADEAGLIWIDVMPGWGCSNAPGTEILFHTFNDITGFRGLWAEETWPEIGGTKEGFIKYLEDRFGNDWRKTSKLRKDELEAIDNIAPWIGFGMPGPNKKLEAGFAAPWDGRLRMLVLEYSGKTLEDAWRESQDYMSSRRKGFSHTYVISTADPFKIIGGIKAAKRLDSLGHESYESFGRTTGYFMERYRNAGSASSVMSEQYNWYCPSNDHAIRGFWQNMIHSKCYYNFALHHIFEQPSWYDNWSWERGRWDAAKTVFQRVAKTPEFYAISETASNAGVILSERSSVATKEQVYFQCSFPVRTDQSACASWTALNQLQVPADVVWAESLTEKLVKKYKFLYLPSSRFITDQQVEILRKFVADGGILFAEGASALFDPYTLKKRDNYALSDVFGCDYVSTDFRQGRDADTVATRHGSRISAYKVKPNADLVYIDDSIHRDVKPVKSILKAKMTADKFGSLAKGDFVEVDAALGIDSVKPTTASVLAAYEKSGRPAVLVNKFGKGICYFVTANNFSLATVNSRWEMLPSKFDFWTNVKQLVGSAVSEGFSAVGASLPVEVKGVSAEVEVSVANYGDKYAVHLLDYDVTSEGVKGASVTIGGGRKIKRVYYPGEKKNLVLNGRTASLRDFKVYDMFVVEFE